MFKHAATKRLAVLTITLAALVGALSADDWPMYRGAGHNGISAETGWFNPSAGKKVLWERDVGIGCSSMAVVGNRVYTMGNSGKSGNQDSVYCLDDLVLRRTALALLGELTPALLDELLAILAAAHAWPPDRTAAERQRTVDILLDPHGIDLS